MSTNVEGSKMKMAEIIEHRLNHDNFSIKHVNIDQENHFSSIPKLEYGLEKVLFEPKVHWLWDPDTDKFQFDQFLQTIPPCNKFDFQKISKFIPASEDTTLLGLAEDKRCQFITSTSSIGQSLGLLYMSLSRMKNLNLDGLSRDFDSEPKNFTQMTRSPTAVILRPHGSNGIRSIVVEKVTPPEDEGNVLMKLGHVLEKFLVLPKEEFKSMLLNAEKDISNDLDRTKLGPKGETYTYTAAGKILMRSQLDCYHPGLPGDRKSFDLKTRATFPIRMDVSNYLNYLGYQINTLKGYFNSFEREYYDMCRSAMLKYK